MVSGLRNTVPSIILFCQPQNTTVHVPKDYVETRRTMNRFLHFLTVDPPPLSQQTYHPNPATHVQAYTATTDETELK